jgi:hypothetical protein
MVPLKFFFKGNSWQLGSGKNIQRRCTFVKGVEILPLLIFSKTLGNHLVRGLDRGAGGQPLMENLTRSFMAHIIRFTFNAFVKSPSAALRFNFVIAAHLVPGASLLSFWAPGPACGGRAFYKIITFVHDKKRGEAFMETKPELHKRGYELMDSGLN